MTRAVLIGMEGPTGTFAPDEENRGFRLALRAASISGAGLEERSYPRPERAAAVRNARRLIEEGVFLLLNFGGPASLEIARLAADHRVPYLFPHTGLLPAQAQRYVFSSFPRYADEAEVMFRYLGRERGYRRIAIVHAANVYGTLFLDLLRQNAGRFGYAFRGSHALVSEKPGALDAELAALLEGRPDAIVLALYPEQARAVMEAKGRLRCEATMVSVGPLTDEELLNVPGGHAEGTLGFCYYPDPARGTEPGLQPYREAMARHHPGHPLNRYSLYGWVFGRLVLEGLQRAGPAPTRERFVDAMESIRDWDSGGIMPPVSFSATNHHAQDAGFIGELRGGCFQPLTGWVRA